MKIIIWLLSFIFQFLDWWNGSKIDHVNNVMTITYYYRFKRYAVYLPYDATLPPLVANKKDKITIFPQQPGLKLFVSAQQLGYDKIEPWTSGD
jgi:hypothetical protein